jgi:hypothetical protein
MEPAVDPTKRVPKTYTDDEGYEFEVYDMPTLE